MSRRRCCCEPRTCEYFADAFDGETGIDNTDWVVCDGTWEEDPSDLYENSGDGTEETPMILMCRTPHPTMASTLNMHATLNISAVGQKPGLIFSARMLATEPFEEGDCPSNYLYVFFHYTGAVVVDGTTTYGTISIGDAGGVINSSYLTTDFYGLSVSLNVRVNPFQNGTAQVYAYINDYNASCICCADPAKNGAWAGLANFGAVAVHFADVSLNEECETNPDCIENHCTLGETCVPHEITGTISNISCNEPDGLCLTTCPITSTGADEGMSVGMSIPNMSSYEGSGDPVYYIWEGQVGFECAPGEAATITLACTGSPGAAEGAACGAANRAASDFVCSGSAGGTGTLAGYSEDPFMLEFHDVYVVISGTYLGTPFECCITFDIIFTE